MKRINQMEPWVGEEEKEELIKTIDSGWITEATKTTEFEEVFATYVGSKYASAMNNGTVTLAAALMAWGIGSGDEVIVPDFTFIASANAVKLVGAEPVLVDIDRQTLCMSVEATLHAITERTKAVMPVHLNGRYPDMSRLLELARQHNLFLLEDAAQALGSRYHGKHLGTLGEVGSFSFSTPKIITTAQGGMLVTDDETLYDKFCKLKNFGRIDRSTDYHVLLGYNFKFSDIQAALGIAQMRKLGWRVNRKKEMYRLYQEQLRGIEAIRFVDTDLSDTAPWFIDILVENRDELASYLKSQGIGARPFYFPIHTQPPYSYIQGHFPETEYVTQMGLWLPSSSFLTDEDILAVCGAIKRFIHV